MAHALQMAAGQGPGPDAALPSRRSSRPSAPLSGAPNRGFTLVETLVALAVLGVALLMGLALIWQQPRILQRLRAHQEALRALEATVETVRAGAVPLISGIIAPPDLAATGSAANELVLWMDVRPLEPPGLYRLSVKVSYTVQQSMFQRTVQTMVWRP